MSCQHPQRWEWDCGCTFGCECCPFRSECASCGDKLKSPANAKQCPMFVRGKYNVRWQCRIVAGHDGPHDSERAGC